MQLDFFLILSPGYTKIHGRVKNNLSTIINMYHLFIYLFVLFLQGLSHEGIFRISGNHKVVESLKATFDKGYVKNGFLTNDYC